MENQYQALSADDQAALAAERLIKSSGALPESRKEAEGGFTATAGGTLIDAGQKGTETMKSQKVGAAITSEPKGDAGPKVTGTAITDEPGRQEGSGGSGGSLSEDDDERARKRKSGRVGVSGAGAKGNLSESGDAKTRSRKSGKVGIGKSEDADADDKDGDSDPTEKGATLSPDAAAKACGMTKAGAQQFFPLQTKIRKGEDEEDDEKEDEEEDEEKSLDVGDLMKSLDTLEAIAEGSDLAAPRDRLAELAEGLANGTLSKSDFQELHDLTKSQIEPEPEFESEPEEEIQKSYQETFASDPTMAEGYDVSAFLERQNQLLAASLDQMQDQMLKAVAPERTRAFNMTLAKSLRGMADLSRQQGELIKSLSDRLEQVENTPLPRKGVSNVRVLQKSMRGEVGIEGEGPTKAQVLDALTEMAIKSDRSASGEPLMRAVAALEAGGEISKSLMHDVKDFMKKTING